MATGPRFDRVLDVVASTLDIIDERVAHPVVPGWCSARGWDAYLLGLAEEDVCACESEGLARWLSSRGLTGVPRSLADLASAVLSTSDIPLADSSVPSLPPTLRLEAGQSRAFATKRGRSQRILMNSVSQRKESQIAALMGACQPLVSKAERIVDVGAGCGHLTRLASAAWSKSSLGLEIDEARVERARTLAEGTEAAFELFDIHRDTMALDCMDFLVGLHACGDVGDFVVRKAAEVRASLALVPCCLQKTRHDVRPPLSLRGSKRGLHLRREVLGLANLCSRSEGVETLLTDTLEARMRRYALRLMLASRIPIEPGQEMEGINRRRTFDELSTLAQAVFARRGLEPPSAHEVQAALPLARQHHAIIRRLSLPRNMLARTLEIALALDRACFLEENGYDASVVTLFSDKVSPRNLAILATAR